MKAGNLHLISVYVVFLRAEVHWKPLCWGRSLFEMGKSGSEHEDKWMGCRVQSTSSKRSEVYKRVISKKIFFDVPVYRSFLQKVFPCSATLSEESYEFLIFLDTTNGTKAQSPKPPFYKTALLFPLEEKPICIAYWGCHLALGYQSI